MSTRVVNKKLLREWIKINGKGSIERLAYESGCSASLVQKLCNDDYTGLPSIQKIDGLCRVTGHKIEQLFPVVENKKKAS